MKNRRDSSLTLSNVRHALCALHAVALLASTLHAQGIGETTGTLVGEVRDDSGVPLPGVTVTVTGDTGSKIATTDPGGKFVLPFLIPGGYAVQAKLAGFRIVDQKDLVIRLNERTEMALRMFLEFAETFEVSEEIPLIDTSSTTTGINIPQELIASLPIARSFTATINLSPGVADAGVGGNLSISGASGLENTYIVDGVNITDPGYGAVGAYSAKFGSMGSGFPPDIVHEVQVMTGGFEPEYGQALGGVVNVVTKSGGNRFAGEVFAYWSPKGLEGERQQVELDETYAVNQAAAESLDGGLHLGGPIVRDRLFFFAAYNQRREETRYVNDPDAPLAAEFPSTTNVRTTDSYALKASASLGPRHTAELSAFGDPGSSRLANQNGFGLQSLDPTAQQSALEYGGHNQALRWSGVFGASLFVEVQAARAENSFEEILGPEADQRRVNDRTVRPVVQSGGLGIFDSGSKGTNLQYSAKATNLWGTHEVRYGAQFEDIAYAGGTDASGPNFLTSDGRQTTTGARITILPGAIFGLPVEKVYRAVAFLSPPQNPTTTEYWSLFAQDSWSLTPRLTARFGVRWEQQRIKGDRAGAEDVTFKDNWAPRVGVTWDFSGDGRSKAFVHAGRFFEKIPNNLAVRALAGESLVTNAFYDLELTEPIPGEEEILEQAPSEIEGLGRSRSPYTARSQYSDEVVAGIEKEAGRGFSLGARLIYRTVGRVLEDIQVNLDLPCVPNYLGTDLCVPPGLIAEDYLTSTAANFITNLDGHYPGYPKLEREYTALELTAQKRFADRWQFLGSYRYARLEGNYEGLFRRDNGQSNPNITTLADFADSPYLGYTYEKGPLPNDIAHAAKLFGSYRWDLGWSAGLAFNYASGRPITELGAIPLYQLGRERLLTSRGALGRTDDIATVDLRAEYDFRLGGGHTIAVGVDVFNAFDAAAVTTVSESSEITNATLEPDPNADFLKPTSFQAARSIRFMVKYSL